MERNYKGWLTSAILLLAGVLLLVWYLFFSRYSGRSRLIAFGLVVVAALAAPRIVRVDGTLDGRGLPKLAWRWSARPHDGLALVAPIATATSVAKVDAPPVTQFFGSNRDGVVTGARLSRDWQTTPPRELWRQPIGAGWSAFAVVDGRAFTQEQRGEEEWVSCYELLTGRLLWSHKNQAHFSEWQGGDGPRATPTVLDGRVYAIGATGILDCLEAETGQRIWSRDVLKENQLENLTWGVSASPLVFDDKVVVTGAAAAGPTVLAYARATGEPLWKSGTDKASYSSPLLATLAGRKVVLSFNAGTLTAHDPADGAVLLDYRWSGDKWPKAAQPVVLSGDRVFVSAGYGMGCSLLQIAATPEGKLAATEIWKSVRLKTQFNSVAMRDGYFYGLDDGLLSCVEVATGQRKWKDGRFGSGQTLLVDDLILVQSEPGPVALVEAKPDGYRELGRLPALKSKTWNHPTLAGRYLLVRNDREVVCYELPVQR